MLITQQNNFNINIKLKKETLLSLNFHDLKVMPRKVQITRWYKI